MFSLIWVGVAWIFPSASPREVAANEPHQPLSDAVAGAVFACCLIILGNLTRENRSNWAIAFLSWRPLVFVGSFSYSIYLLHAPIMLLFLFAVKHFNIARHTQISTPILLYLVGVPIILGICYVFYLICERPFLNSRKRELAFQPVPQPNGDTHTAHESRTTGEWDIASPSLMDTVKDQTILL